MSKLRAGANALRPDRSGRVAFADKGDSTSERESAWRIAEIRRLILAEVPMGRRVEVVKMLLALEREARDA